MLSAAFNRLYHRPEYKSIPSLLLKEYLTRRNHQIVTLGTHDYAFKLDLDVLHMHHFSKAFYWYSVIHPCPIAFTPHNPFIASGYTYGTKKGRLARHIALSRCDTIVTLSRREQEIYKKHGSTCVIPNGLRSRLYTTNKNKEQCRKKHDLSSDKVTLLFVGQFRPFKGITYLLKAYQRKEVSEKIRLVIKTDRKVELNGVRVIAEPLPLADLVELYHSADMYIQPSLAEGQPTTVKEAMFCGLPVLASDVGGVSEEVEDGKTGFLFSPRDVDSMAKLILYLAEDENLRVKLGRAGRKHALKHFTQNRMGQLHLELYQKLANS